MNDSPPTCCAPVAQETDGAYVLITAAYNEAAFIGATIEAVLAQTVRPVMWVIVSDGSTDGTDDIVRKYAAKHEFIRFVRMTRSPGHSFRSKVIALRAGQELLFQVPFAFIGNLDSDITLDPSYFEELTRQLQSHTDLGIVSGFVYEDEGAGFRSRWFNTASNVPHAAQLVRRECYEAIGGYAALKHGGEDWHAQTSAKMRGWKVQAVPELKIYHHRRTGAGSKPIRNAFRLGCLDYSFGSDPLFEVTKCVRKFRDNPYVVAGIARLAGFTWCYVTRDRKAVSAEFESFLRREQRSRLSQLLRSSRPQRLSPHDNHNAVT